MAKILGCDRKPVKPAQVENSSDQFIPLQTGSMDVSRNRVQDHYKLTGLLAEPETTPSENGW